MRLSDIPREELLPPKTPRVPISAAWGDRKERAAFRRYWLADRLAGPLAEGASEISRLVPVGAVSSLGAALAPAFRAGYRNSPASRVLRRAVSAIRPDLSDEAADALLAAWWRNTARVHAEIPRADHLVAGAPVPVAGFEHLAAPLAAGRPIVAVSVHLGNWELAGTLFPARIGAGSDWFGLYEPQNLDFVNRIIHRVRTRNGVTVMPPNLLTSRRIVRLLSGGAANAILFIDAIADGVSPFPLFGRPMPARGQARVAVKLARLADAAVVPCHLLRIGGTRFAFTILPEVKPPAGLSGDARDAEMIRRLSAIFEPVVREHLDQWYMMHAARFPTPPGSG